MINKGICALCALLFTVISLFGQEEKVLLDEIVGVIGSEIVLKSNINTQREQIKQSGYLGEMSDCTILEELMMSKLLLNQSKIDSVDVPASQVESELDNRLRYFIGQLGSQKKLEDFYKKSIVEIKEELRGVLKEQMLVQRMQSEITSGAKITPAEVKAFFNGIPKDSLPKINSEIEMAQIVVFPKENETEVRAAKEKLRTFKKEVEAGEKDFETLAIFYSEDPGSAPTGGNLGMVAPGTMVPEFDAVAQTLQRGEVSNPFETEYGFHIMQMITREGERYDSRHILLKPKTTAEDLDAARLELQNIVAGIETDTISFEASAVKYSMDEASANNGGIMSDPYTGSPRFDVSKVDPKLFFVVDNLKVGEYSEIKMFQDATGKRGYRVVKLLERTKAHRANMNEDYQIIYNVALQTKQQEKLKQWVAKTISKTYVRINDYYGECEFKQAW